MVISYILSDKQRQAIKKYLREKPSAMSPEIRQIRFRGGRLDFDLMESDLRLLKCLVLLKIPKGRKSKDMMAVFAVRQGGKDADIAGKFTVLAEGEEK